MTKLLLTITTIDQFHIITQSMQGKVLLALLAMLAVFMLVLVPLSGRDAK